jgi:hypothetical protein
MSYRFALMKKHRSMAPFPSRGILGLSAKTGHKLNFKVTYALSFKDKRVYRHPGVFQ